MMNIKRGKIKGKRKTKQKMISFQNKFTTCLTSLELKMIRRKKMKLKHESDNSKKKMIGLKMS